MLASNRNAIGTDALADATLPADGTYFVRITEFAHQGGGADYSYRLTLTTGPWIDAIFPPLIPPGQATAVTIYGRNLPGGQPVPNMLVDGRPAEMLRTSITAPALAAVPLLRSRIAPSQALVDTFEFRLPGTNSNAVLVGLSTGPIQPEAKANNTPETAEAVPVPCEIAGRIEARFDRDWYSFEAKKGDVLILELVADRLGSEMDAFLTVRNAANGAEIVGESQLDDDPESVHPLSFFSRSADPAPFRFNVPADGTYRVLVGSRDGNINFGPRNYYHLRISRPQPGYRAFVMPRSRDFPTTAMARAEGEAAYDVFLARQDGFNGPVLVNITGLPAGITAAPLTIGRTQKWGTLVLTGAATLPASHTFPTVTTTATISGKTVTQTARPATITWPIANQQNTPTIARLDQSLVLVTRPEKALFRLNPDLAGATGKGADGKEAKLGGKLFAKAGEKITVPVKVVWQDKEARANPLLLLVEPTTGSLNTPSPVSMNNNQPISVPKEKADPAVVLDVRANAPPGQYAITLRGETNIKYAKDPMAKEKKDITAIAYSVPFTLTVLPTSLGKFTAQPAGNLKLGQSMEVLVKVDRQFDYEGEYPLVIELPKDTSGVTVTNSSIPAGATEARCKLSATKEAK
ncbi:MAG: PPC domain-containing protein, partial [Gemmataceae bacterium]